jgi:hypothetical protein
MRKIATLTVVIVMTIAIWSLSIIADNNNQTLVSETGCCSIHTHKVLNEDVWMIRYNDNTNDNLSYSEVVTTEYDMEWIVNEMQDICYTHHYHQDN